MPPHEGQIVTQPHQAERVVTADNEPAIVGQHPFCLPQHLMRIRREIEAVSQQAGIHAPRSHRQGERIPLDVQQASAGGDTDLMANGGTAAGEFGAQGTYLEQVIAKEVGAPVVEALLKLGGHPVPHGQCGPTGRKRDLLFGTCQLHNGTNSGANAIQLYKIPSLKRTQETSPHVYRHHSSRLQRQLHLVDPL